MKFRRPNRFRLADSAQQIVGGFLLAGPFVVTEEVWVLAADMTIFHALATICVVAGIGYAALYKADTTRDIDVEQEIAGVPARFISLLCVSFGSVLILAMLFDAPDTFLDIEPLSVEGLRITFNAISVGSVFSIVGAATADTIFSK
ncbi:DUF2391 family protein [Natronorubrum aibiense]|uniref:DUF2391 family protein n=1 Tax=Natronorubrum aibiense TaxID=348826 RepID=A0A5P9P7I3_9EURY|nr:DUF2391 family protein [Natronorubrum aibiense]QFU84104.1 DUF2391 family protein [Natronorubrum aibiense]